MQNYVQIAFVVFPHNKDNYTPLTRFITTIPHGLSLEDFLKKYRPMIEKAIIEGIPIVIEDKKKRRQMKEKEQSLDQDDEHKFDPSGVLVTMEMAGRHHIVCDDYLFTKDTTLNILYVRLARFDDP